MLLWITLKIALNSLAVNKLRSSLTMLGVIIGVGAVIAMLSLGSAFGQYIGGQITSLGTNVLFVRAGQFHHGPMSMVQTLTPADAHAMLNIKGVKAVCPMVMTSEPIRFGDKTSTTASVMGVAPSLAQIQNLQIERGSMIRDEHVEGNLRKAVLGPKVVADIFGNQDPIGQTVRIKNIAFEVIGVTKSQGDRMGYNPDDSVLIPYTTAMKQLPPHRDYVQSITVETYDKESMSQVTADMSHLLRRNHHLRADEADDFSIQNMTEFLDAFNKVSFGLTMFLGTVAAISLVVGGIGIMNIMLATVAERTRETGIRKAIGAKDRDIMRQFLIEALVLTLGGGLLGLALGYGIMKAVAAAIHGVLALQPELQWWVVGLSIAISMAVGLVSGLYPAYRASRMDPVTALRYE